MGPTGPLSSHNEFTMNGSAGKENHVEGSGAKQTQQQLHIKLMSHIQRQVNDVFMMCRD